MKRVIQWIKMGLISVFLVSFVTAQGLELKDQFDQAQDVSNFKEILYASDMEGYKLIKKGVTQRPTLKEALAKKGIQVVADISGMPGFISKYVAVPKMKELPISIFLDHKGDLVSSWPKSPKALGYLSKTPEGQWSLIRTISTLEELEKFLSP